MFESLIKYSIEELFTIICKRFLFLFLHIVIFLTLVQCTGLFYRFIKNFCYNIEISNVILMKAKEILKNWLIK
jgi:hypothetical protein